MFTNYTNCLPAWSVGPNCYEKVYGVVAKFGKSAAVIGGKTALSKAYGPLQEALAGTDFKLSEPVWYRRQLLRMKTLRCWRASRRCRRRT